MRWSWDLVVTGKPDLEDDEVEMIADLIRSGHTKGIHDNDEE